MQPAAAMRKNEKKERKMEKSRLFVAQNETKCNVKKGMILYVRKNKRERKRKSILN